MGIAVSASFSVTVVYSPRAREWIERELAVPEGCTAAQAIQLSGVLDALSADQLKEADLGVWGRKVPSSYVLRANDRVELYRPLTVDPKVARRERFNAQGSRGAGLFAKRRPGAKPGY
jgi:putative ubiquitin-RnfH superfamily antitoxin RatB of RatAB toxin-antitoxin module